MQVYWKLVENYTLYFMYGNYLKLETFSKPYEKEVQLRNNFNLRNDIDFIFDTQNRKSTLKFKNLICLNCERVTIAEKFIKIKNDWIFKFYNKRVGVKKVDHDASIDSAAENENEMKVKLKADLVEDRWTDDMKLPLYFRKMYKIDRFNKKDEILFFTDTKFKKYKESLICINCYLRIVKMLQRNQNHGTNIYDNDESKNQDEARQALQNVDFRVSKMKEILAQRREMRQKHKRQERKKMREQELSKKYYSHKAINNLITRKSKKSLQKNTIDSNMSEFNKDEDFVSDNGGVTSPLAGDIKLTKYGFNHSVEKSKNAKTLKNAVSEQNLASTHLPDLVSGFHNKTGKTQKSFKTDSQGVDFSQSQTRKMYDSTTAAS